MLVANLPTWSKSPPPRERKKKKLAPRRLRSRYDTGYGARNRRLPYAGDAIQLEDVLFVSTMNPVVSLLKEWMMPRSSCGCTLTT